MNIDTAMPIIPSQLPPRHYTFREAIDLTYVLTEDDFVDHVAQAERHLLDREATEIQESIEEQELEAQVFAEVDEDLARTADWRQRYAGARLACG